MKKLFSFLACVAMMISFAACSGNDPDAPKTVEEAKEQVMIWGAMIDGLSEYLIEVGELTEAQRLANLVHKAQEACKNENATLEELTALIDELKAAMEPYAKTYFLVYKKFYIEDMDDYLEECSSPTCQQIVEDGKTALSNLNWDDNKSFEQLADLLQQLDAIDEATADRISAQIG